MLRVPHEFGFTCPLEVQALLPEIASGGANEFTKFVDAVWFDSDLVPVVVVLDRARLVQKRFVEPETPQC